MHLSLLPGRMDLHAPLSSSRKNGLACTLGLGLGRRRPEAPKVLKAVEDRVITKWGIVCFAKALQLYCSV